MLKYERKAEGFFQREGVGGEGTVGGQEREGKRHVKKVG